MRQARILIVEDEMYLAMMLEDLLTRAGYVVSRAARLAEAMALASDDVAIDAAILDINLDGVAVYPLAQRLQDMGVPFLFASAYGDAGIPDEYSAYQVLAKPYPTQDMLDAVGALLAR